MGSRAWSLRSDLKEMRREKKVKRDRGKHLENLVMKAGQLELGEAWMEHSKSYSEIISREVDLIA